MKTQYYTQMALACALALGGLAPGLAAQDDLQSLRSEIDALKKKVDSAAEWKEPQTLAHMAGYADVGYTDSDADGEAGTFNVGTFAPIFHYQFSDLVMLESELELEVGEDGSTEVALEYLTVDLFLNDYTALVVGKFLSPLGQFRQNLHPSWINKAASAPAGFGHDQAAPNAEVGAQLRGGFPMGGVDANYALYIANGPALEFNGAGDEVEMIETPGLNKDGDGKKVVGGRFGMFFPDAKLDVGLSYATGEVASLEDPATDPSRNYEVSGVDFNYRPGQFDFRGEYIKQEFDPQAASSAADGGVWEAVYVQGAYQFLPSKWEAVVRYGEYDTPHASEDRDQWLVGANYLFASNVVAKFNYEFNDNPNAGQPDDDRLLLQLAYGF